MPERGATMDSILPEIDLDACNGCGDCLLTCETGALELTHDKAVLARPDQCQYDGRCEPVCPTGAISLPYLVIMSSQAA
jgi:NAD-dependent dihydropyrimidine dehydrogenase PreA subunit